MPMDEAKQQKQWQWLWFLTISLKFDGIQNAERIVQVVETSVLTKRNEYMDKP